MNTFQFFRQIGSHSFYPRTMSFYCVFFGCVFLNNNPIFVISFINNSSFKVSSIRCKSRVNNKFISIFTISGNFSLFVVVVEQHPSKAKINIILST